MGNKRPFYIGSDVKSRGNYYRHNGLTGEDSAYVDIELEAGMLKVVADNTERDAIPPSKRKLGLVVYVSGTKIKYQLLGGVANTNWVPFNLVEVFANGGSAVDLIVGNKTREKGVIIDYVMERGSLVEMGRILITGKSDTLVSRSDDFDFCGIEFVKKVSGDNIILTWTDSLNNGTDTNMWASVKRLLF